MKLHELLTHRLSAKEELRNLGRAELTKTHEVSEIVKIVENMI